VRPGPTGPSQVRPNARIQPTGHRGTADCTPSQHLHLARNV
jgi:hypothetical protein